MSKIEKDLIEKIDLAKGQEEKSSFLVELASYLCESNPEKGLKQAEENLLLATATNNIVMEASSYRQMAHALSKLNKYDESLKYVNLALEKLEGNQDLEEEYFILMQFGRVYRFMGELDTAKKYYERALELAEKIEITPYFLRSCANLAYVSHVNGNFTDAKLYIIKALARDDEKESDHHAFLYNGIGIIYTNQGVYEESLYYYKKAYTIWEKLGITHYQGYVLNNIGTVYQDQNSFEEAYKYLIKALDWFKETKDLRSVAMVNHNLGENHILKGEPELALPFLDMALEIGQESQDKFQVSMAYYAMAWAHFEMQSSPQIIKKFLDKASIVVKEINNKDLSKKIFELYSKLHIIDEDLPEAVKYQSKYLEVKEELYEKDIKELFRSQELIIEQLNSMQKENLALKQKITSLEEQVKQHHPSGKE